MDWLLLCCFNFLLFLMRRRNDELQENEDHRHHARDDQQGGYVASEYIVAKIKSRSTDGVSCHVDRNEDAKHLGIGVISEKIRGI